MAKQKELKALWGGLLGCVLVFWLMAGASAEEVILQTQEGPIAIEAELADTPQKRSRGLMHRDTMGANKGMLFDFKLERQVAMWMKNTLIELDMLFAKGDGTIIFIKEKAQPGDLTTVMADEPVRWVLELNGGYAKQHKVQTGDRLIFPPQ